MRLLLLTSVLLSLTTTTTVKSQCTRTAPFQDGGYVVTGNATMTYTLSGNKTLDIDSGFSTMEGPDLYVYLTNSISITTSSTTVPDGTIELGVLTSSLNNGMYEGASSYTIPMDVSINDYAYVVIQCKQFNAFWGFSQLGTEQGADCSSLSVDEEKFKKINFYPNPTKDKISFNIYFQEDVQVNVYNSYGIIVVESEINKIKNEISLSDISSGIYYVELISDRKKSIRKLIIK